MTSLRVPRDHSITHPTGEHTHLDVIAMGIMTALSRRTAYN